MKIYLAGYSVSNPKQNNISSLHKLGSKLHSFYHCSDQSYFEYLRPGLLQNEKIWFEVNMKNKVDLFLDSGAFSAWSQGVNIDIQQYITFIKAHEDVLTVYVNLDVIGDPEGTWRNQMIMERAGLRPLPVFHYKEDLKWLKRYLKRGYDYIAIGGLVTSDRRSMFWFLDDLFSNYLCDSSGLPIIKTHAFGLTGLGLMLRYPWYSVDSTSWVVTGRMGSIYVPRFWGGKYIYDKDSWKITVSARSPGMLGDADHIDNMRHKRPRVHQQILDYIHSKGYKLGKSSFKKEHQDYQLADNEKWAQKRPEDKTSKRQVEILEEEGLCNKYQLRDELNIIYFLDLEKSMPEWPWAFEPIKSAGGSLGLL